MRAANSSIISPITGGSTSSVKRSIAMTSDHGPPTIKFCVITESVPRSNEYKKKIIQKSLDNALAVLGDLDSGCDSDYELDIASEEKSPIRPADKHSFRRELLLDNMEMLFKRLLELNNGEDDDSSESSTDGHSSFGDIQPGGSF